MTEKPFPEMHELIAPGLWGSHESRLVADLLSPPVPDAPDSVARALTLQLAAAVSTLHILLDEHGAKLLMDLTSAPDRPAPERVRWPTDRVIYVEFGEPIIGIDGGLLHGVIFTTGMPNGIRSVLSPTYQNDQLVMRGMEIDDTTFRVIPHPDNPQDQPQVSQYHLMIHLTTSPKTKLEPLPLTLEQSVHLHVNGAENPWYVIRPRS